jgi:hypothetical protein
LSDGQQFHQYQQKSPLILTHWVMVNNSTNINKNHLSPQLIHSMSWGERWFLLILVELLTITQWVEVRGDLWWYWWNCWPSLNELKWEVMLADIGGIVDHYSMSWGERWCLLILVELLTITQWVEVRGDYQQTPPVTLTHWVMVNNSTNINKNHLSP